MFLVTASLQERYLGAFIPKRATKHHHSPPTTTTTHSQNKAMKRQLRHATAGVLLLFLSSSSTAFLLPTHFTYARPSSSSSFSSSRLAASPKVTPELITHTATLAQLQFDEAEVQQLVPRFEAFLRFVDKMQDVPDTAPGLASSALPPVAAVLRPDQSSVFPNQDGIFANMPDQEDAYLSVPKVGEEDT